MSVDLFYVISDQQETVVCCLLVTVKDVCVANPFLFSFEKYWSCEQYGRLMQLSKVLTTAMGSLPLVGWYLPKPETLSTVNWWIKFAGQNYSYHSSSPRVPPRFTVLSLKLTVYISFGMCICICGGGVACMRLYEGMLLFLGADKAARLARKQPSLSASVPSSPPPPSPIQSPVSYKCMKIWMSSQS